MSTLPPTIESPQPTVETTPKIAEILPPTIDPSSPANRTAMSSGEPRGLNGEAPRLTSPPAVEVPHPTLEFTPPTTDDNETSQPALNNPPTSIRLVMSAKETRTLIHRSRSILKIMGHPLSQKGPFSRVVAHLKKAYFYLLDFTRKEYDQNLRDRIDKKFKLVESLESIMKEHVLERKPIREVIYRAFRNFGSTEGQVWDDIMKK